MPKQILIYGAGTYGKIVYHDIKQFGEDVEVASFVMDEKYVYTDSLYGIPIVPFEKVDNEYPPEDYQMLVCCGYTVMRNRKIMYDRAKDKGYKLANYISSKAILENTPLMGDNNIVLANAVIGYDGKMGSDNIIFQNVWLGHEFKIGSHSIIGFGSNIGGRAVIGNLSYISIGVTAKGRITFGDESLVGVGTNVIKDVEPFSTVVGNPAKTIGFHYDTGVIVKEKTTTV